MPIINFFIPSNVYKQDRMVDPTQIESGDTIERLKEMFGAGGGTRRIQYEIVEVTENSVMVEAVENENSDVYEVPEPELRNNWYLPDNDK